MAKNKKKYKKKKNPNRTPQNRKPQSASAKTGKASGVTPADPERQKRVWIAAGVAVAVFLLLILIAYFNGRNQNASDAGTDAETTEELTEGAADATTENETESEAAENETEGDAESEETAADAQSGDTTEAESGSVETTATADNGESDAAAASDSTDSEGGSDENAVTDNGTSDAATTDNNDANAVTADNSASETTATDDNGESDAAATSDEEASVQYADITVKDYGMITVELDPETAPITVKNFTDLAESGFYDGLTFHRIMDGFMIQGGDPLGNGTGGSSQKIEGEFAANGHQNSISHTRGAISMARASGDNNSASSQFFIMQADNLTLDGQYAAFGHVTSGMEVVDKICADAHPTDDNGTIPKDEQPVIETIVIRDK